MNGRQKKKKRQQHWTGSLFWRAAFLKCQILWVALLGLFRQHKVQFQFFFCFFFYSRQQSVQHYYLLQCFLHGQHLILTSSPHTDLFSICTWHWNDIEQLKSFTNTSSRIYLYYFAQSANIHLETTVTIMPGCFYGTWLWKPWSVVKKNLNSKWRP